MTGDALVVPIRVEALPVGERDTYSTVPGTTAARGIAPHADFAAVEGRFAPYVGAQVVNRLFSGGRPLERGVHVHWHLPRSLLRAVVEPGGPEQPPNLAPAAEVKELAPPPAPDRWLVTRLAGDDHVATGAWVVESNYLADEPLHSQTTIPLDRGRRFAYLGRVHTLADWQPTSEGGEYFNGLHAFGYGIPDFAGCYANCRNVFGLRDAGLVDAPGKHRLTYVVVGWHDKPETDPLANGTDPAQLGWTGAGQGPRRTLYVGAVRGVTFDPGSAQLVRQQSRLTPKIAVGNTLAEALSALASARNQVRERLFTSFQLGGIRRLGGVAKVEETIHAAGFSPIDAGVVHEIQTADGQALADVAEGVALALSDLNRLQDTYDRQRADLTTLRRRLYADFYRRAQLRAARWRPPIDLDALDDLIERELEEIDAQAARLIERDQELAAARSQVGRALPQGAMLVAVPAPRYFLPNDPVVVLCGDGIPGPPPDAKGELTCAVATALPVAPDVPGLEDAGKLPHRELARLVALVAAGGAGLPEPEIALRDWQLPWRPIELAWRVALQLPDELDTTADLDRDVVLRHYRLDPEQLDFEPRRDDFSGMPDEYEGRTPLAGNATAGLELQLRGLIDDGLLDGLRAKPLVAQALGGFTRALAMLDQGLQLPVADPFGSALDAAFVERIAASVADQGRLGPLPENPFAPLRSGRFRLSALRLVDEFGRWREVDASEPLVAETIPADGAVLTPPLRLSHAARLGFRWRIAGRAGTDASELPAAGPICGWVVPNHLDGGLMLYGEGGAAVGRLLPAEDGRDEAVWLNAPQAPEGLEIEEALAAHNAVLRGFALALRGSSAYLSAFAQTLETARATIAPGYTGADRELAALVGDPLALVQAELDLTLLGLPPMDLSHPAFLADIARGDPLARTDRGLTDVRFPVLLGNRAQLEDGLIGFFAARGETVDYEHFFAAAAAAEMRPRIVRPPLDTVRVTAAGGPVVVTMLIDPRCPVHATTGILPVKSLAVPGDLAARGMAALDYTFLAGPLLVPPDSISVPTPTGGAAWSWVDRGGEGGALRPDMLAPQDLGLLAGRRHIVDGYLRVKR